MEWVVKGWGQPLGVTGKEREGTASQWDLQPITTNGAGDAAQLLQHLIVASCSPGPLTLPFADFQFTVLHLWSNVLMCVYYYSPRPGLYNDAEEVIKTHL